MFDWFGTGQPVGLKGSRLQKGLAGSYFAAFSTNRITIGLQNPQNLPSPSHFFAAILQARQTASRASDFHQHTAENTRKDHNVEYTPPGTLERIANPHRMRDSSVEGTRDRQGRTVRDV
jgi:hypothetical protein